jgi:hypothetical protein
VRVLLREVLFHNENGIDVDLTIEAPVGEPVFGPKKVVADAPTHIPVERYNCISVLIMVKASPDHEEEQQTFATAKPQFGKPIYLESVDVRYHIGSFRQRRHCGLQGF